MDRAKEGMKRLSPLRHHTAPELGFQHWLRGSHSPLGLLWTGWRVDRAGVTLSHLPSQPPSSWSLLLLVAARGTHLQLPTVLFQPLLSLSFLLTLQKWYFLKSTYYIAGIGPSFA